MIDLDYENRTLCSVLDDMRACFKTYNFAPIKGLIEEAQIIGNRMEAGLNNKEDADYYRKQRKKLRLECKELEEKIEFLKGQEKK